jgi:hypothetical protein
MLSVSQVHLVATRIQAVKAGFTYGSTLSVPESSEPVAAGANQK